MKDIIAEEKLQGTIAYLDNVTICGKDQEEHDENLKRFQDVASRHQITYNDGKSVFSTRQLAILGYIEKESSGQIQNVYAPSCSSQLRTTQKVFAMFSDFFPTSTWIQCYSEKIRPLTTTSTFPISREAQAAFENLKKDIAQSVVCAIDEDAPFGVETDASDFAIVATLNQNGRPVAFFSRMSQGPEISHASVEKVSSRQFVTGGTILPEGISL